MKKHRENAVRGVNSIEMGAEKQCSKYVSLALMIMLSLSTQVLGVAKSSVVAGIFGATQQMDAYNFANSFLTFLFSIITAAVPTIIIPCYVKKKESSKAINGFITIIYGCMILIAGSMVCLRKPIITAITNRGNEFTSLVCEVLLILTFAHCFGAVNNITMAFFQSQGKYNLPKLVNLIVQLLVVGFLLACRKISILDYTWIVAAGIMLGFALDLYFAFRCGWRYLPTLALRDPEIVRMIQSFLPIMLSTSVYQLSLMTDSLLTERLEEGMLTILVYASQISAIVNSVVLGNLQVYIYPRVIRNIQAHNSQKLFWKQSEALHCIVWLVIAGFLVVGREGISILFEHGAFSSKAADMVYWGAGIYILGQQFNVIRDMIYKYFYANGNTKVPSRNSIVVSINNIVISLILMSLIGFYGVILGTVCASGLSLLMILCRFKKNYGFEIKVRSIFFAYGKNAASGVTTTVIMLLLKEYLMINNDIIAVLVYGFITIVLYSAFQRILNKGIIEAFKAI